MFPLIRKSSVKLLLGYLLASGAVVQAATPSECRTNVDRFLVAKKLILTTDEMIKNDPNECSLLDAFQIANDGENLGTNKCGNVKLSTDPYNGLLDIEAGNRTFNPDSEIFLGNNTVRLRHATLLGDEKTRFFRVATDNAHLILSQVELEGGKGQDGGAILVESGASLSAFSSKLNGNEAENNGGAIAFYGYGTLLLHEVVLNVNSAKKGKGGAIFLSGSEDSSIQNTRIFENFAATDGGGLAVENSVVDVTASYIEQNQTSSGDGGGIHASGLLLLVQCSSIFENEARHGDGGGLYVSPASGSVKVFASRIEANVAGSTSEGRGGGVFVGDDFTAQHASISFNASGGNGAGLYIDDAAADDQILIENTTVSRNETQHGLGGAFWITGYKAITTPDEESPFGMQHSFEILHTTIENNAAQDAQITIDDAGYQDFEEILFLNNIVTFHDDRKPGCAGLVQRLRFKRYNDSEPGTAFNLQWPDQSCGMQIPLLDASAPAKNGWLFSQTYSRTTAPNAGDQVVCAEVKNQDQFKRDAPCKLGAVRGGPAPSASDPYAPM